MTEGRTRANLELLGPPRTAELALGWTAEGGCPYASFPVETGQAPSLHKTFYFPGVSITLRMRSKAQSISSRWMVSGGAILITWS